MPQEVSTRMVFGSCSGGRTGGWMGVDVPLCERVDHCEKAPTDELLAKTDSPAGSWNLYGDFAEERRMPGKR